MAANERPQNPYIEDGTFGSGNQVLPEWDDEPDPHKNLKQVVDTGFSQRMETVKPASVLVCLDCETYYPDGDDWEYCPNCSAKVFEVRKD